MAISLKSSLFIEKINNNILISLLWLSHTCIILTDLNFKSLYGKTTSFTSNLSLSFFRKTLKYKFVYNQLFHFKYFRFVLFAGLGYKRKFYKAKRILFSYIADRHWILYKFNPLSTIIPAKRRSFLFISKSKNIFNQDYIFFSSLRTPYVYKMKGFLDSRVKRRFIFIRRLKLRGIKTKLSKKQQML